MHKALFPTGDVNLIAKKGADRLTYRSVCQELDAVLKRLAGIPC